MASYRPKQEIVIPEPCSQSWEAMEGGARVRHCASCATDVVNTATMTAREIDELLAKDGPLPCMRVAKYADGSMMVASESRGMTPYGRAAAVAMAALVTISLSAPAQTPVLLGKMLPQMTYSGRVVDAAGKPVVHAKVRMAKNLHANSAEYVAETDANGDYRISLVAGEWEIEATGSGGYATAAKVVVREGQSTAAKPLVLQPVTVTAGAPMMQPPKKTGKGK